MLLPFSKKKKLLTPTLSKLTTQSFSLTHYISVILRLQTPLWKSSREVMHGYYIHVPPTDLSYLPTCAYPSLSPSRFCPYWCPRRNFHWGSLSPFPFFPLQLKVTMKSKWTILFFYEYCIIMSFLKSTWNGSCDILLSTTVMYSQTILKQEKNV